MTPILTYSEDGELACELVAAAREISPSAEVAAVVLGDGDVSSLSESGCDVVCRVAGAAPVPEVAASAVAEVARQRATRMVLVGSTKDGKEVAGRLSVLLGCPAATECSRVGLESGRLRVERMAFGGRVSTVASMPGDSFVVALRPRAYARLGGAAKAGVTEVVVPAARQSVSVESVAGQPPSALDLTRADRIVSVGRGLKKKEDLELIRSLAGAMDASIGCSRPLSADLGWLGEESHIGLTGIQVKPKLYLAVGISGQLQHLAGIRDAGVVVAINNDKTAPIFSSCDYGVVGDLYQVVPELVAQLSAAKGREKGY